MNGAPEPKEADVIFHGGCHGCYTQSVAGVDECRNCQYFDADWSLPNLFVGKPDRAEIEKMRIKKKYGIALKEDEKHRESFRERIFGRLR